MARPALPLAYFDTSVLMKRYLWEAGAVLARALLRRHRLLSSAILPVEALAVLGRHRDGQGLSAADHAAILGRLQDDRAHWDLLDLTRTVLARAERLAMEQALRTLDALHVASAIEFETAADQRVPFVTADRRQRDAALRVGLDVTLVA
jgi:predicted nucleic acid-binding protein